MKKRILMLLSILLMTGCTCEYNLTIDGQTYKEEIIIIGETNEEIASFNKKWEIPTDKEVYNSLASSDSVSDINEDIYEYKLLGNKLTFNSDFTQATYKKSTAVSQCYNKISVTYHNNSTVISTSQQNNCFKNHPPLNNLKITITVDREVTSNNADVISGNKYIWNITKENAANKSINLILKNKNEEPKIENPDINNNKAEEKKFDINNWILYIFLTIFALLVYFGYKWFLKFKDKNNNID